VRVRRINCCTVVARSCRRANYTASIAAPTGTSSRSSARIPLLGCYPWVIPLQVPSHLPSLHPPSPFITFHSSHLFTTLCSCVAYPVSSHCKCIQVWV
jgi:hypothetical protein